MGKLRLKLNPLGAIILIAVSVYGFIKLAIPFLSRKLTGLPFPLPVPGALIIFYMTLTLIALFLYVSLFEDKKEAILAPVAHFLRGEYGIIARNMVLAALPLFVGWQIYDFTVPKINAPVTLRIQHPSSNFPRQMESLANPYADTSDTQIDTFIEAVKKGEIEWIPEVAADVHAWKEMNPENNILSFIPTGPIKRLIREMESGNINKSTAKEALREKNLFEGRALYAINCSPCHGAGGAGDGEMADGLRLRPVNFIESGTIETIVEGYAFWRVSRGGFALPPEATPWDSAMPEWRTDLTDDEIWKIILAEYDLAGKTPRIPETYSAGREEMQQER